MKIINIRDENTGNIISVDLDNPSGIFYVTDNNTGNLVRIDLTSPSGNLNIIDANTGNFTLIDLANPTGIISVLDNNTGQIKSLDLSNPSGILFVQDANTGDFIEVDLSVNSVITNGYLVLPVTNNVAPAGDPIGDTLRAAAVAHWTMDETSGTTRNDSKSSFPLTDANSDIGSAVGKIGSGALFNSTSQSLQNADPIIQITTGFSIVFWFKVVQFAATSVTLIIQHAAVDNIVIEFEHNSGNDTNTIGLYLNHAASREIYSVPAVDQWHLFIGWCNSSDWVAHMTLDDSTDLLNSAVVTTPVSEPVLGTGAFMISPLYSDSIGQYILDEVAVFARELSSDERTYLYNSGAGRALFP